MDFSKKKNPALLLSPEDKIEVLICDFFYISLSMNLKQYIFSSLLLSGSHVFLPFTSAHNPLSVRVSLFPGSASRHLPILQQVPDKETNVSTICQ